AMVALISLIGAGCGSNAQSETGAGSSGGKDNTARHEKAVKFAKCMRNNGVSEFPDPGASGELTIDAIANGSSLDTSSAACKQARPHRSRRRTPQEWTRASSPTWSRRGGP